MLNKSTTIFSEQLKDALKRGDYDAFKKEAPKKLLTKIHSEEVFFIFKERYSQKQEIKDKAIKAIQNDDFDAFKAVKLQKLSLLRSKGKKAREIPEGRILERFNAMVSEYKKTGEVKFGHRGRFGHHLMGKA